MIHALDTSRSPFDTGFLKPAKILEINDDTKQVLLMFGPENEALKKGWAIPALPFEMELRWGQTVLAAPGEADTIYVIGVLNAGPGLTPSPDSHVFDSGARADIGPDKKTLKLFSKTGSLVFEYDDRTGKCRVENPSGDVEFSAPHGNIDFTAAKGLRFSSALPLAFESLQGVRLDVADPLKNSITSLHLGPGRIEAKASQLDIQARSGQIHMDTTAFHGDRFTGKIRDIRLVADRMETLAGDIIQKAGNLYHTVENLVQTTTRRLRTLVAETCHIKTRKMFVKAEEDVKIKGEKIHLG